MLFTLAGIVAVPLGIAAFFLYDRLVYRDDSAGFEEAPETRDEPALSSSRGR